MGERRCIGKADPRHCADVSRATPLPAFMVADISSDDARRWSKRLLFAGARVLARTQVHESQASIDGTKHGSPHRASSCKEKDPRVTVIGLISRVAAVDEVPLLLSILWGHMSSVGPRAERPELVA